MASDPDSSARRNAQLYFQLALILLFAGSGHSSLDDVSAGRHTAGHIGLRHSRGQSRGQSAAAVAEAAAAAAAASSRPHQQRHHRPRSSSSVRMSRRSSSQMLEETKPLFVSANWSFPFLQQHAAAAAGPGDVHRQMSSPMSINGKILHQLVSDGQASMVFLTKNNTRVKAHTGSTVTLPCIIKKESKFEMITWARQLFGANTSYQILTIGDSTYIEDPRFLIDVSAVNYDWSIKMLKVEPSDSGVYKCQANSHPPQFITVYLNVIDAYAKMSGPAEKFIKTGSELFLNCSFHDLQGRPDYVFWYHNSRMVSHSHDRGLRVQVSSASHSTLQLPDVRRSDSGNYTCAPHNLRPASVYIHIIDEDSNSAAAAIHTDEGGVGGSAGGGGGVGSLGSSSGGMMGGGGDASVSGGSIGVRGTVNQITVSMIALVLASFAMKCGQ